MAEFNTDLNIPVSRAPTSRELAKWNEAKQRIDRCYTMAKSAVLLWQNLRIMSNFITQKGISVAPFNAKELSNLETRFLRAYKEITSIRNLCRQVEDQELGLVWTGADFNVVSPPNRSGNIGGFFIPVIAAAVVLLSGLIGRLVFLEKEVKDVRSGYNEILTKSDNTLCSDPSSKTCKEWKSTKESKQYEEQKSFSDKLKDSIASVGGKGIGIGIVVLAAMFAFSALRKS
jgi:hypothetical protein